MSPRRWQARIGDILASMDEIHSFVAGMSFDEFRQDMKALKAVMADFIIIGEAAAGMPDEIVAAYSDVPWSVMRGMRNTLVHAYFDVDPKIVWDTIQQDLPGLVKPLRTMLESSGDPTEPA